MKTVARLTISYLLLTAMLSASTALSACAQLKKKSEPHLQEKPSSSREEVIPQEPIGTQKGELLLVYPRGENNNKIDASSTFLVGKIPAGRTLTCNQETIQANSDGYFSHVVKLSYGKNDFKLTLSGQESAPLSITVERPAPPALLSASSFNILPESLEPKEALGVSLGDIVQFAARATPGAKVSVKFAGHHIPLTPALGHKGKGPSVNLGLDTAFGVTFQRSPAALKDLYLGFYKIQAQDSFDKVAPVFFLEKGQKQIKAKARGSISIIKQPSVLSTAHANTIVRLGPGQARTTPLPEAVRLLADGYKGDWWRFELCPNRHVWVAKEDIAAEADNSSLPESRVSTVNLGTDSYGARIAIPLNQRLPYQIEQDQNGKKLVLRIFGATADTDFVTSDLHPSDSASKLIDFVSWKQKGDLHYELSAHLLNSQQWGFFADYEDKTLVLHIKSAPAIDPAQDNLKGAIICVDPGHGGKEIGSIGCSGTKEATVNFAIADKLRKELESMGATVIMTRTADQFVSLQERVDTAIAAKADMLISVHNNALPDGRDPNTEHGTSSYWYHPQSIEFARLAQKQLSQASGFKDFGSRYQNLALCRPTQMPAVLMEIGFMINPDELSKLLNPQFQELTAKSIGSSVKKFMLEKVRQEKSSQN